MRNPFKKYFALLVLIVVPSIVFSQQDSTRIRDSSKVPGYKLSEIQYYNLGKASLDSIDKAQDSPALDHAYRYADSLAKAYINDYPDKTQGYWLRVTAAKKADRDTSKGLAIEPINEFLQVWSKDTSTFSRNVIGVNLHYTILYYLIHAKNMSRIDAYSKTTDALKQIVDILNDPNNELYQWASLILKDLTYHPIPKFEDSKPGKKGKG